MEGDEVLVMTSLVIIFAVFVRRRRSFIQGMRLMSLQNDEEDAMKCFNSVNPTTKQHNFSAISTRLCGLIQDHNSGLRIWLKKWKIQWGGWDCKSKEMTVLLESFAMLIFSSSTTGNCLKNNVTRLFGRHFSQRATQLTALIIRAS